MRLNFKQRTPTKNLFNISPEFLMHANILIE